MVGDSLESVRSETLDIPEVSRVGLNAAVRLGAAALINARLSEARVGELQADTYIDAQERLDVAVAMIRVVRTYTLLDLVLPLGEGSSWREIIEAEANKMDPESAPKTT